MLDNRLKTLITLMDTKSYTKTALELFITQPAVTQHIKSIEKQYNVALFSNAKAFKLSPAGQLIYDYAIKAQSQYLLLESALLSKESKSRKLTFSVTRQIALGFMRPVMRNWLTKHPRDKITLLVDKPNDILSKLDNGLLDFAIVDFNFDRTKYDSILIARNNILPICSRVNQLSTKLKLRYETLSEQNLIIDPKGTGMRSYIDTYFASKNINLEKFFPLIEINDPLLQLDMIETNQGIGFVYESVLKNYTKRGFSVLNVNDLEMRHEFFIICNKDNLNKIKFRKYATELIELHDSEVEK